MQTTSADLSPGVVKLLEAFPSQEQFLQTFPANKQREYCTDLQRAYMGNAPRIGVVAKAYGDNISIAWLSMQLIELSEYSGCREKLSPFQLQSISEVILSTWGHLKVTEIMHFFLQFKAGRYGKFYGAVDGLTITEALQTYSQERVELIREFEKKRSEEAQKVEAAKYDAEVEAFYQSLRDHGITLGEYLAARQNELDEINNEREADDMLDNS